MSRPAGYVTPCSGCGRLQPLSSPRRRVVFCQQCTDEREQHRLAAAERRENRLAWQQRGRS